MEHINQLTIILKSTWHLTTTTTNKYYMHVCICHKMETVLMISGLKIDKF
ncbi:hypothetical protein DOY81_007023 [Sarcophaga bullata]|nr:hypothetical protein DOY81_007023 [Sarcophaga bullata]